MIKRISYTTKTRKFATGYSIDFRPGINALVGDQGCGKSTVLDSLAGVINTCTIEKDPGTKVRHFDFEKFNPRLSTAFGPTIDLGIQVQALWQSHGQATVNLLADFCKSVTQPHTFLLDEPDTGLSIRSGRVLGKFFHILARYGHQVIASVHNLVVITAFDEVYSVEHGKWMTPRAFIATQLEDPA